jgi:hypothetical protein
LPFYLALPYNEIVIKTNVTKISIKNIKKTVSVLAPIALFTVLVVVIAESAHADSYLGNGWDQFIGNVKTFPQVKPGEELAIYFIKNAIRIIRYLVGSLALVMGMLYGMSLIFARGKEDTINKQKTNFLWMLLGFVILIISENVAGIFNPETAHAEKLIDFNAARDQLRDVVNYIKWMMGSVVVLFMTISGIRMITADGEEEMITKQKQNIKWGAIGMLIILLATSLVNALYVIKPGQVVAGQPETTIQTLAGVIRLILVFLGPAAILFTLIAGLVYLTAFGNEERTKTAKTMIVAGVTAIVVIYAAYTIVNTIAVQGLTEPTSELAQLIAYAP